MIRAAAIAFLLCLNAAPAAWAGGETCNVADDIAGTPAALPHVAEGLKPGKSLAILGVGSATMFGPEAAMAPGTISSQALGGPEVTTQPQLFTQAASKLSFPLLMADALRNAVSGSDVKVSVRGGRSLLAADTLALLKTEVASRKYNLVLWQIGTVDAVRNLPPGEFSQVLLEGIEAVHEAGADLVLIDPQYSRFLQTNTNLEPYTQALSQAASMPGVVLFRRFDLMRAWVNEGQLDLERTPKADRKRAVEALHACLGRYLSRLVLESSRS